MDSKDPKPQAFYLATSIPYVNDVPHLGHAMEFVLADVIARYQQAQGNEVFFSTGTDEHGGKVMEKAASLNITPEKYAEQISLTFRDLADALNIGYTKFIRTTDKDHEARAQQIWIDLEDNIYKDSYIGMYDTREEEFITLEAAKLIKEEDPKRYERLEQIEEENYFFKLSNYTDPIKKAITSGDLAIHPESRKNEILALLETGLEDVSVSRPKTKIPWGIAVPGDPNQTMYVWFEALMNYITTLEYPDGVAFKAFWPGDTHVIGKDILRFHAAIWPAMLMGLGLELPKTLYVHGFINIDGEKMSKSVGNVVAPLDVVSTYGVDAFRYYITKHIPSNNDGDFTWAKFETAYNSELGNDLGNLVQRTSSMIDRYQAGVIGDMPESMHDVGPYHENFDRYRFDLALEYVWTLIRGLNQYIEEEKPWAIAKAGEEDHLQEILAYLAASLLQVADLIGPFMPDTAQKIVKIFGQGVIQPVEGTLFPKIYEHTEPRKK